MQELSPAERLSHKLAMTPAMTAAVTAVAYMVMCGLYIVYASRYAAQVSESRFDLLNIETLKGMAFVLLTGLIYFALAHLLFRQIHRQDEVITAQEAALVKSERRIISAMSHAVIAHDLNNLLMPLNSLLGTLREQAKLDESLRSECADLENGIGNLGQLCKRMISSSSLVLPERIERVDLHNAIPALAAIARRHPDARYCLLTVLAPPPTTLTLNRVLLEEAVLNLLLNAAQAAGPRGRVEVRLESSQDHVILAVHDDGPGVPEEVAEQIFEPCFTTKPEGSGIGLVAVKGFASSCKGEISVDRSPLGGALFQIRIPRPADDGAPLPA